MLAQLIQAEQDHEVVFTINKVIIIWSVTENSQKKTIIFKSKKWINKAHKTLAQSKIS